MVIVGVGLASGALVGVPFYLTSHELIERQDAQRLVGSAESAALDFPVDRVLGGDVALAEKQLDTLRREARLKAAWIVLPSGERIGRPGPLAPDEEAALRVAWEGESSTTRAWVLADGSSVRTAFAPVDADGDGHEDLAIAVNASTSALESLSRLRSAVLGGAVLWMGILGGAGWFLAGRVSRPLRTLVEAVSRLERGTDFVAGAPSGLDELEVLRGAVERMAKAVRGRELWLRALAGSVAHEVRNPANAAKLDLDLLARSIGSDVSSAVSVRLAALDGDLREIEEVVASFLAFARDRAARRVEVSLRDTLCRATGARVDAPDVRVAVDPVLLGRAVANLVRNAEEAGGRPEVRAWTTEGMLHLAVCDDGPGFRTAAAETAFVPFATDRSDGTGLGLALVAAIATAHGGRAWLARPGPGGTEVRMDLALPPSAM